jgi:hypothetical protein
LPSENSPNVLDHGAGFRRKDDTDRLDGLAMHVGGNTSQN